jgi:hypothetical protein
MIYQIFICYPVSFVCECQMPPQTGFNAHHTFETGQILKEGLFPK